MLFSSIISESSALLRIFGCIIFFSTFVNGDLLENVQRGAGSLGFSFDFEKFLKELEIKVYNSKSSKEIRLLEGNHVHENEESSTSDYRKRFTNALPNTHRGVIGDALMMKLVSYYEEKYQLTRDGLTTEPGYVFEQISPSMTAKNNAKKAEEQEAVPMSSYRVETKETPPPSKQTPDSGSTVSYDDAVPEVGII